jgi:hypothetical protein
MTEREPGTENAEPAEEPTLEAPADDGGAAEEGASEQDAEADADAEAEAGAGDDLR